MIRMIRVNLNLKLLIGVCVVLVADWLFWVPFSDAEKQLGLTLGWTIGLFLLCLLVGSVAANHQLCRSPSAFIFLILAGGQCLAAMDYPSILNTAMFLICAAIFVLHRLKIMDRRPVEILGNAVAYLFVGPLRFIVDHSAMRKVAARISRRSKQISLAAQLGLPIVMGVLFIGLFRIANPVIEQRLESLIKYGLSFDLLSRALFWFGLFSFSWALIRPSPRWTSWRELSCLPDTDDGLFNPRSVLFSLVLFNIIFAVQNILDIEFLWTGLNLPPNITAAEYAHRGAYPLVVTALLAAGFVLICTRERSGLKNDSSILFLTYLWIAQNIFLLFSSISRLMFYVEQYSLTYLRVAAFIWMGLVALGLLLILIRLWLRYPTEWLLNANLLSSFAATYVASMINFGGIIADYNVAHCAQMTGKGPSLDIDYVKAIGPRALPALQVLAKKSSSSFVKRQVGLTWMFYEHPDLKTAVSDLQCALRMRLNNWRSWTAAEYRVFQSLKSDELECRSEY